MYMYSAIASPDEVGSGLLHFTAMYLTSVADGLKRGAGTRCRDAVQGNRPRATFAHGKHTVRRVVLCTMYVVLVEAQHETASPASYFRHSEKPSSI